MLKKIHKENNFQKTPKNQKTFLQGKHIVPYLIFGVLTTVVNVAVFWLCRKIGINLKCSTVIAWIMAVLFAYVTNRTWVFHSEEKTLRGIIREILSFFLCRISTGILDLVFMTVFAEIMGINELFIKITSNIIVVILNYIGSRIIFRK
ncbi:MAG: GtrA family protein [Armatimonadetes bacterium]|nr:GtrA family protein [Candidatus Hippobium faecium]